MGVDRPENITVLMPAYNAGKYIGIAVRSILAQTYVNFELLIIDDGSTDNTADIVKSFPDSRIRYVYKEHSETPDTLNTGLELASYDWVMRIDSDDIAHPERLERLTNYIKGKENNHIVSNRYGVIDGKNRLIYKTDTSLTHEEIKKRFTLHSEIVHPLYNRKFILENGGYKNNPFEDYELFRRLKDKAVFSNLPEYLYFYRVLPNSRSRENIRNKYGMMYSNTEPNFTNEEELKFGLADKEEADTLKGWREFFYGKPSSARKLWKGKKLFGSPRLLFAFFITYLPPNIFIRIKEQRLRFRLKYLTSYFSKENIKLRKTLEKLVK